MKRDIIHIDDEKCTGCGLCVPNCHEGALQIIDGKAVLISDLMCDGLGACIGHCPEGAITIESRDAEPYDEVKVMEIMVSKGFNTVVAHLQHLREHSETGFLKQGMGYLVENAKSLPFSVQAVKDAVHAEPKPVNGSSCSGGCPSSQTVVFNPEELKLAAKGENGSLASQLRQWPVQMHLINPIAPYFRGADLLVAADCTAFTMGNFHQNYLKDKSLVIACPKLDSGKEIYLEKLITLINEAKVNTITVLMMEVPCCGGLQQLVQMATLRASRKVPVKAITVSIRGEVLEEEWV